MGPRKNVIFVLIALTVGGCGRSNLELALGTQADATGWAIAVGGQRSYHIRAGALWAWGDNSNNQLGTDDNIRHRRPARIGVQDDWRQVSAGETSTCAINATAELYCWGNNGDGELGLGDTARRSSPTLLAGGQQWKQVSVGRAFACAIRADTSLWCWGSNWRFKTGIAQSEPLRIPTRSSTLDGWHRVVASAGSHACGLRSGSEEAGYELWCWGTTDNGVLGTGAQTQLRAAAQQLEGRWSHLAVGPQHNCAIRRGGEGGLWCWGNNVDLSLGADDSELIADTPQRVGSGRQWSDVAAGLGSTCAVKGGVYCWGAPDYGQLGAGDETLPRSVPVEVAVRPPTPWTDLLLAEQMACAMTAARDVYCWGSNGLGELGVGGLGSSSEPQLLSFE